MVKRILILIIITIFFLATALPIQADEWGTITIPANKPVKIGLGAMLTGNYASLGIDIKNGAEMAVQEKGRILGHSIVLQAEDDGCSGPPSVAIAEKLCNDPLVVGLVGYICSGINDESSGGWRYHHYLVLVVDS